MSIKDRFTSFFRDRGNDPQPGDSSRDRAVDDTVPSVEDDIPVHNVSEPMTREQAAFSGEFLHKPVDLSVIVELCDEIDVLLHGVDDNEVRIVINDVIYRVSVSEGNEWLRFAVTMAIPNPLSEESRAGMSEEEATSAAAHVLIDALNSWNTSHIEPTGYINREGDQWMVCLDSSFHIIEGLTARQLFALLARASTATEMAMETIPGMVLPTV